MNSSRNERGTLYPSGTIFKTSKKTCIVVKVTLIRYELCLMAYFRNNKELNLPVLTAKIWFFSTHVCIT